VIVASHYAFVLNERLGIEVTVLYWTRVLINSFKTECAVSYRDAFLSVWRTGTSYLHILARPRTRLKHDVRRPKIEWQRCT